MQASQPATACANRDCGCGPASKCPRAPDWFFVKLHAHGAPERDRDSLLGPPMRNFHDALARLADDDPDFHVHYVTAREMVNLALAAEAGWTGGVAAARDFAYLPGGTTVPGNGAKEAEPCLTN